MRNVESWLPTKFVIRHGRLRASKDRARLSVGSRLVAELIGDAYSDAFARHARGRLLDMGCGSVPFYEAYRPHVTEITCIDWSNSYHPNPHLDLECDLSNDIPLPDGSFDTILLSDVLEHLPDPIHCWREIERLLAPGGKLLLNVPFYYQIHEEPHDYHRYTEFALRRFADTVGPGLIELRPTGGAAEVLADVLTKLLLEIPGLRWAATPVQATAISFYRSRIGKRLAAHTGARSPLGYFLVAQKPVAGKS